MRTKRLLVGAISTSLAALTLVTQSANATEALTEAQAITKVQYLVDSLNSEVVTGSSQSDSWTSDFPILKTKLDALSVQLNAFGERFSEGGAPITSASSTLSNCSLSATSNGFSLECGKTTIISMYSGTDNLPIRNVFPIRAIWQFDVYGNLVGWTLDLFFKNEPLPVDTLNFVNSELDNGVEYSRPTRMLPPLNGWTGLSNARKLLVVAYAQQFDGTPNPAYAEFSEDCANFVSQALKAGGWKVIGDGSFLQRDEYTYWGYWEDAPIQNSFTTRTWTAADWLYKFTTQYTTRGFKIGIFKNEELLANQDLLEPGDLIFVNYDSSTDTRKDHVMVVTQNFFGEISVSAHNKVRENEHLDIVLKENKTIHPNARWIFIRT